MTKAFLVLLSLSLIAGGPLLAQNYQCNWSVVDQGGGLMSSTSFRATPSVGQTAIGLMTSTSFQGFIGFWQIDTAGVGIQEDQHWNPTEPLVTALYAPFPSPSPRSGNMNARYSLAAPSRVSLQLFDLTGRNIATFVNGTQPAGRYSVPLITTRPAAGVYFLKLRVGDYCATRKLVVE
jgi:hypothetical protein